MENIIANPDLAVIADFIGQCLPFEGLPEPTFNEVISKIQPVSFPKGYVFSTNSDCRGLQIIRSGVVELRSSSNQLVALLGERDNFHLLELEAEHGQVKAIATEECLIYLLQEHDYQNIRRCNRDFDRFFHKQCNKHLRRAVRSQPISHTIMQSVRNVMSSDVFSVNSHATIQYVAQAMSERHMSSVLVIDEDKLCGIVTDRDLRSRVLAVNRSSQALINQVMTANPCSIKDDATLFDVMLLMTQKGFHHLPVVQNNKKVVGIITASDLMLARQDDPIYLVQHIHRQNDIEGIECIASSINNLLVVWSRANIHAGQITNMLTAISNAVTERLIELAVDELGPAPVPFSWLGFGSQARGELLVGSDQDNGLLIADNVTEQEKSWFDKLAQFVCDGLNQCGYIYCPGDVMATTTQWCQTLSGWKNTVDGWMSNPTPDAILQVSVFFDLRSIYGETELFQQLQSYMLACASRNSIFLAALAGNVLQQTPPLGIFRRFLVERTGKHKNALNLKQRGTMPIVDMVRIYALANNISAVNTEKRLEELLSTNVLTLTDGRNLQDAYNYLMQLRVKAQADQLSRGEPVSNYYSPESLPDIGRKHLKDVFTIVHEAQESIRHTFRQGL